MCSQSGCRSTDAKILERYPDGIGNGTAVAA